MVLYQIETKGDFGMVDVLGIGPCINGQYSAFEVDGRIVDAFWSNPWGDESNFSICEVNGCGHLVIGIGKRDQYGRYSMYEVDNILYEVNWIDRTQAITSESVICPTFTPSFFPSNYLRKH